MCMSFTIVVYLMDGYSVMICALYIANMAIMAIYLLSIRHWADAEELMFFVYTTAGYWPYLILQIALCFTVN